MFGQRWCLVASLAAILLATAASAAPTQDYKGAWVSRLLQSKEDEDKAVAEAASRIRSAQSLLPRINFKGEPVSNSFDLDNPNYVESMQVLALAGAVVAGACLLWAVMFTTLRFCCGSCGGKASKAGGYSLASRVVPKIIIFLAATVIFIAAIMGWVGNARLDAGVDSWTKEVRRGVDKLDDQVTQLGSMFDSFQPTRDQRAPLDRLESRADAIVKTGQTNSDLADDYEFQRYWALNGLYAFFLLTAVLGFCAALFNWHYVSITAAMCGFLSIILVWCLFAVHLPASVLLSDFCLVIADFIEGGVQSSNSTTMQGLKTFLSCAPNATAAPLVFGSNFYRYEAVVRNPDSLNALLSNSGSALRLSSSISCYAPCQPIASNTYYFSALCDQTQPARSSPACVSVFQGSTQLNETAMDMVTAFAAGEPFLGFTPTDRITSRSKEFVDASQMLADSLQVQSCSYLSNVLSRVDTFLCVDTIDSMSLLVASQLMMGICFAPFIIAAVFGFKRFNEDNQEENAGSSGTRMTSKKNKKGSKPNRGKRESARGMSSTKSKRKKKKVELMAFQSA
eukprot:PLAT15599.1.p1 GENE.PLAT15599.1~~PLAT15599.1.p1  ORF type:complete len:566 (-),score=208.56 PLAT15599.1:742-2439(-)